MLNEQKKKKIKEIFFDIVVREIDLNQKINHFFKPIKFTSGESRTLITSSFHCIQQNVSKYIFVDKYEVDAYYLYYSNKLLITSYNLLNTNIKYTLVVNLLDKEEDFSFKKSKNGFSVYSITDESILNSLTSESNEAKRYIYNFIRQTCPEYISDIKKILF